MNMSPLGIAIMQFFENYRPNAYYDQHGVPTIGYGHTGPDVQMGMTCTLDQALAWFAKDLAWAERAVTDLVTVPLTQHQFDALVSFTYNAGRGALASSSLLTSLNAGDMSAVADMFLAWDHIQGVVNTGLQRRRVLERALFLEAA